MERDEERKRFIVSFSMGVIYHVEVEACSEQDAIDMVADGNCDEGTEQCREFLHINNVEEVP
jgi:hypothetical protein